MKSLSLLVSVLVPFLGGSAAVAGPSIEALKANDLVASVGALRANALPAPATVNGVPVAPLAQWGGQPQSQQRMTYGKTGYTFDSEAQNARAQAEGALRQAGVVVLVSNVYRDSGYPYKYGFRIEYLQENGPYQSQLETYSSAPTFTFDSDARREMDGTVYNFRSAGYRVVLGEVRRQDAYPYRYFYQIDYFKTAAPSPWPGNPGRGDLREFRSGHYRDEWSARSDMNNFVTRYRYEGKEVVRSEVRRQNGWYFFQITYREARRGPGRPFPR